MHCKKGIFITKQYIMLDQEMPMIVPKVSEQKRVERGIVTPLESSFMVLHIEEFQALYIKKANSSEMIIFKE